MLRLDFYINSSPLSIFLSQLLFVFRLQLIIAVFFSSDQFLLALIILADVIFKINILCYMHVPVDAIKISAGCAHRFLFQSQQNVTNDRRDKTTKM